MPFAAAVSEHPVTATAIGETAGQLLETLGPHPGIVTLFVTPHHTGALEDAARAVRAILEPGCLVGCAAEGVIADGREIESTPGVVLWAGTVPAVPVRLTTRPSRDGETEVLGWPDGLCFVPSLLVLVTDPFSFAAADALGFVATRYPRLPVVGGNASAGRGPGGNRLAVQDEVVVSGAVGALIGPAARVAPIVSQGCRPIGHPFVVTKAEGNVVFELGGKPAYERLLRIAGYERSERGELLSPGIHLGVVVDEYLEEYRRGDFLVHRVVSADTANGSITVSAAVEVGTTAQYHVRDGATADEDLRLLLRGHDADGALVFASTSRGRRSFNEPDHDAALVDDLLDRPAAGGFFAAGEYAPIGHRNFTHAGTASIALLRDRE